MNVPNKLTLLRIILVPIFMCAYLLGLKYTSATVFIVAAITDWADGYLARKNHLITNFGKFMDPLADKLLVTAALLCLVENGTVASWVAMVIIAREFIVTGIRLVAASEGKVIAAGKLGKFKTVTQLAAMICAIIAGEGTGTDVLMYLAAAMTVISGIDYIMKNTFVFDQKN